MTLKHLPEDENEITGTGGSPKSGSVVAGCLPKWKSPVPQLFAGILCALGATSVYVFYQATHLPQALAIAFVALSLSAVIFFFIDKHYIGTLYPGTRNSSKVDAAPSREPEVTGSLLKSGQCDTTDKDASSEVEEFGLVTLTDSMTIPVMVLDRDWRILQCNASAARLVGAPKQFASTNVFSLLNLSDADADSLKRRMSVSGCWAGVVRFAQGAASVPYRCELTGLNTADSLIVVKLESLEEIYDLRSELERSQRRDDVTGLLNRRGFEYELNTHISSYAPGSKIAFPVLVFDINGFSRFSVVCDRDAGDQILKSFSVTLGSVLPLDATIARLHADRFAVYFPRHLPTSKITRYVERLRSELKVPLETPWGPVAVDFTVGVDYISSVSVLPRKIVANAEYAAKNAKQNPYRESVGYYKSDMADAAHRVLKDASYLANSLRNNRHFNLYLPVVGASDYALAFIEPQLKFPQASSGFHSEFLASRIEEEGFLAAELSWTVLDNLVADFDRLSSRLSCGQIILDVSSLFRQEEFVENFLERLEAACIPLDRITIGVAESILMQDLERSLDLSVKLREVGASLLVLAFTGSCSSFSCFNQLKIAGVKLHPVVVQQLSREQVQVEAAEVVLSAAKALGAYVIAGGVDSAEQAVRLRNLGVDFCQGMYFAKHLLAVDIDFNVDWRKDRYVSPDYVPVS